MLSIFVCICNMVKGYERTTSDPLKNWACSSLLHSVSQKKNKRNGKKIFVGRKNEFAMSVSSVIEFLLVSFFVFYILGWKAWRD